MTMQEEYEQLVTFSVISLVLGYTCCLFGERI